MCRHAPDLTVFSFPQNDFQPTGRNRLPISDWRISLPKILWFGNTACLTWQRNEIAKIHPLLEFPQSGIGGHAFDLDAVELGKLVARIGDSRLQTSIASQYDQALRIGIKPTGGIHRGDRNVVGKRRPPVAVRKLRQDAIGLV